MGNVLKKSLALLLAITLLPIPAHAGVRDMIVRAKQSFEAEDEGRSARRSAAEFMKMESSRMALMAQKNQLMAAYQRGLATQTHAPDLTPPPVIPIDPTPSPDDFFAIPADPDPIEKPEKPMLTYSLTFFSALLKYGADIRQTTGEFFKGLSEVASWYFRQVAYNELYQQHEAIWKKYYEYAEKETDRFVEIAYQAALYAKSFAYEAARIFGGLPVDSHAINAFLAEVETRMDTKVTYIKQPDGTMKPAHPLFEGWDFDAHEFFGNFYDLMKTDEQLERFNQAYEWLDRFDRAVYASQQLYNFAHSYGMVYYPQKNRAETDAWVETLQKELDDILIYLPELADQDVVYKPYRFPVTLAFYQDEKGNYASYDAVEHRNFDGQYDYSYRYDGTLSKDMQEVLSGGHLYWRTINEDYHLHGVATPDSYIDDKYADFMSFYEEEYPDHPIMDYDIFRKLLGVKTVETGHPTRWDFFDPATDEFLASVEIPDSETLPANTNPLGLGMPLKVKEFYEGTKLALVEIQDLETQSILYIQKTKYSDRVIYDPVSGQVYEGVITDTPDASYESVFSHAAHQGESDDSYFDEYFDYYFSPDDTNGVREIGRSLSAADVFFNNAYYHLLSGFNSEVPEGAADKSVVWFANGLISKKIARREGVGLIPMFEGNNIIRDYVHWNRDGAGLEDDLTSEVIQKLKLDYSRLTKDQLKQRQIVVTYSGSTNPTLKAIARTADLPVDVMISWGGPVKKIPTHFDNERFQTYINAWGSNDFLVQAAGFSEASLGPRDLSKAGVNTINIEILNATHTDFWYSDEKLAEEADPVRREINRKTSIFLQELAKASISDLALKKFLDTSRPGITQGENKVYTIDLTQIDLVYEF